MKSFNQQRLEDFLEWSTRQASLPGMEQATFLNILEYVLKEQGTGGFWTIPGTQWKVVMTAVVLKGLAALQFRITDRWRTKGQVEGGVQLAIDFLTRQVETSNGRPEAVGEDIWDACQVALALAEFGKSSVALPMVQRINGDWKSLYDIAMQAAQKNRWAGPAYLAAIVEVMGRYETDLVSQTQLQNALSDLKNMEKIDSDKNSLGFQGVTPRDDIDLWTTSLVLRALSKVPKQHETMLDRPQLERLTNRVLAQLEEQIGRAHV